MKEMSWTLVAQIILLILVTCAGLSWIAEAWRGKK